MEVSDISLDLNPHLPKRRKFYRKRETLEDETHDSHAIPGPKTSSVTSEALTIEELISYHANQPALPLQQDESKQPSAAEIIRQHKAAQRRRFGVEFTNEDHTKISAIAPEGNHSLTEKDDVFPEIKTVVDRFAPQTGQVANVDKHM